MIPAQNIVAWGNVVPWTDGRQVEQDLIISCALVEIFSDLMLREALRFRGGTAFNKLHFPAPLRYSEDIDLVRTSHGPIGPVLDQLRVVLEPWLGRAQLGVCAAGKITISTSHQMAQNASESDGGSHRLAFLWHRSRTLYHHEVPESFCGADS